VEMGEVGWGPRESMICDPGGCRNLSASRPFKNENSDRSAVGQPGCRPPGPGGHRVQTSSLRTSLTMPSPAPRRILALDYGLRRVGVAISDVTGTLATPLTTLKRRAGKRPPIAAIIELVRDHVVEAVVVGLPLDVDGGENEWTEEVRAFGGQLERRSGLRVFFMDERYSSVEAEARIRSIGLSRKARENKARIDAGAAAIFLQDWLDARRTNPRGSGGPDAGTPPV